MPTYAVGFFSSTKLKEDINIAINKPDHKYILGFGCKEEICQREQAAFAIERQNTQIIAVLITSEGDYFFGVDRSEDLPGNLQTWYTKLKETQTP